MDSSQERGKSRGVGCRFARSARHNQQGIARDATRRRLGGARVDRSSDGGRREESGVPESKKLKDTRESAGRAEGSRGLRSGAAERVCGAVREGRSVRPPFQSWPARDGLTLGVARRCLRGVVGGGTRRAEAESHLYIPRSRCLCVRRISHAPPAFEFSTHVPSPRLTRENFTVIVVVVVGVRRRRVTGYWFKLFICPVATLRPPASHSVLSTNPNRNKRKQIATFSVRSFSRVLVAKLSPNKLVKDYSHLNFSS